MTDRLSCCVPFCKRTTRNDGGYTQWCCGKHWRLVDKYKRRRDSKLVRTYVKRFGKEPFWHYPAGSPQRLGAVKLSKLCEKSWELCKRQAIERAAGI